MKFQSTKSMFMKFMSANSEIICLVLIVIFMWLFRCTDLSGSGTLKQPPAPAQPFFSLDSSIEDYYQGDIGSALEHHNAKSFIFLMIYVPWDAESRKFRLQYELVAHALSNYISFVAVNCWHHDGECAQRYRSNRYPVLVLFLSSNLKRRGIQYSGPLYATHIIPWLKHAMAPLQPLYSPQDIYKAIGQYQFVIMGTFNFSVSLQPTSFRNFYTAAMRTLEHHKDFGFYNVIFAVAMSSQLRQLYNLQSDNVIILSADHSIVKCKLFHSSGNSTADNLLQCMRTVIRMKTPVLEDLQPTGIKSARLANLLSEGPLAVLFTPLNPLLELEPRRLLWRNVALAYGWCDATTAHILNNVHVATKWLLDDASQRNTLQAQLCHQWKRLKDRVLSDDGSPASFRSCFPYIWREQGNSCTAQCERQRLPMSAITSSKSHQRHVTTELNGEHLAWNLFAQMYPFAYPTSLTLIYDEKGRASFHSDASIQASPKHMLNLICATRAFAQRHNFPPVHSTRGWHSFSKNVLPSLAGLGCGQPRNRTLRFVIADPLRYPELAHSFGVDVDAIKSRNSHDGNGGDSLVLVDAASESIQVHKDIFTSSNNLTQLLVDFHASRGVPFLRSQREQTNPSLCFSAEKALCVEQITRANFLQQVIHRPRDVLLLYYMPLCIFCSKFHHLLIHLANFFRSSKRLVFARIDVSQNDLPFHYRVARVPAIIFFPSDRKSESVAFPLDREVTLSTLVRFVLAQSSSRVQLAALTQNCAASCVRTHSIRLRHHLLLLRRKVIRSMEVKLFSNDLYMSQNRYHFWLLMHRFSKKAASVLENASRLSQVGQRCAQLRIGYVRRIVRSRQLLLHLERFLRSGRGALRIDQVLQLQS